MTALSPGLGPRDGEPALPLPVRFVIDVERSIFMSGIWVGRDPTCDRAGTEAVVGAPRGPSHARARTAGARQDQITRRDRRRAQRLWRLTLADHLAHWRARHRPHATPGWWPR